MAPGCRSLLDLPIDVLQLLPAYMSNLEDFTNISSTCRRLRTAFISHTPRKTILHLACRLAASGLAPAVLRPHPDTLALATARQLAEWVAAAPDESEAKRRTARLVEAFHDGIEGILNLALSDDTPSTLGLHPSDLARMHKQMLNVVNPLTEVVDAMVGKAWYSIPDFWDTVSDAFTLYAESGTATRQLLLYGELFGPTMDAFLTPGAGERLARRGLLDAHTRIECIKYSIPDWVCRINHRRNDGFELLPVGPFSPSREEEDNAAPLPGNQTALNHLVGGPPFCWKGERLNGQWGRAWSRLIIASGVLENEDGRWPETWQDKFRQIKFTKQKTLAEKKAKREAEMANRPNNRDEGDNEVLGQEEEEEDNENQNESEEEEDDDENSQEEDEEEEEDENEDNEEEEEDENEDNEEEEQEVVRGPEMTHETEEEDGDWRFRLFWAATTQVGGIEGMEMVAQFKGREWGKEVVMKPEWKQRIINNRDRVLALDDEDRPDDATFGIRRKLLVSQAPHLRLELYYCCAGLWSQL